MRALKWLFTILLFYSCNKDQIKPSETVEEVYNIILREAPEIGISYEEVELAMRTQSSSPCTWDFNFNGLIENSDLLVFLSMFGDPYTTGDMLNFLAAFGESYIVDIVPAWNNYLGQTNCNNSFNALIRTNCNGNLQETQNFDSLSWYYNGAYIFSGNSLNFQGQTQNNICEGWTLPCSGKFPHPIELRVYVNDRIFSRQGVSFAINSNTSFCEGAFDSHPDLDLGLFIGPFEPYQFCTNCD